MALYQLNQRCHQNDLKGNMYVFQDFSSALFDKYSKKKKSK